MFREYYSKIYFFGFHLYIYGLFPYIFDKMNSSIPKTPNLPYFAAKSAKKTAEKELLYKYREYNFNLFNFLIFSFMKNLSEKVKENSDTILKNIRSLDYRTR